MPRPKRCRRICSYPDFWSFAPEDAEEETEESVVLLLDEFETIRQIDYGRKTQEECAAAMGVSRATVTSIYEAARYKLAEAIICGKRIRIAGGAYQIEEALPGAVAKQVRQVAALEGNVLQKTRAVMIVMTALTLIAATIAVANLMSAAMAERASQLALLKAIGAKNSEVSRLIIAETAGIALAGAVAGAAVGAGLSQLVGHTVFHSAITMRPMVFVLVAVLLSITVLTASISAVRQILKLQPAQVLHGR